LLGRGACNCSVDSKTFYDEDSWGTELELAFLSQLDQVVQKRALFQFVYVEIHLLFADFGCKNAPDKKISFKDSLKETGLIVESLGFDLTLMFEFVLSMLFDINIVKERVKILTVFTWVMR
jgi:hypothetical protein